MTKRKPRQIKGWMVQLYFPSAGLFVRTKAAANSWKKQGFKIYKVIVTEAKP